MTAKITQTEYTAGSGLIPHDQVLRGHHWVQGVQQVQGVHAHQQVPQVPAFQAHPE